MDMPLLVLLAAFALGLAAGLLAWALARARGGAEAATLREALARAGERADSAERELAERNAELATLRGELERLRAALARAEERAEAASAAASERGEQLDALRAEHQRIATELAALRERIEAERRAAAEIRAQAEQAREQMTVQFRQLSQDILDERARRFAEASQSGLKQILDPLRERIERFEKQVADTYERESRDRTALIEQVRSLQELNRNLSEEARNLTRALRGQSKTQGNWGELVLERILEASGLTRGREYEREFQTEGKRPDAVIFLPEGRSIIIDAKVSLNAYLAATEAESEAERRAALDELVASMRRHIQGLSAKDYQHIEALNSPDFVLMFVPSEGAYIEAIRHEPGLHEEAMARHIGLVAPSTLLPVLRTVEYIWRVDNQNRNAQEIARQAGALYDKFVGFQADMESIGKRLDQAHAAWSDANKKLYTGRGSLVSRAEKLRKLGASANKRIERRYLEADGDEIDDDAEPAGDGRSLPEPSADA